MSYLRDVPGFGVQGIRVEGLGLGVWGCRGRHPCHDTVCGDAQARKGGGEGAEPHHHRQHQQQDNGPSLSRRSHPKPATAARLPAPICPPGRVRPCSPLPRSAPHPSPESSPSEPGDRPAPDTSSSSSSSTAPSRYDTCRAVQRYSGTRRNGARGLLSLPLRACNGHGWRRKRQPSVCVCVGQLTQQQESSPPAATCLSCHSPPAYPPAYPAIAHPPSSTLAGAYVRV